MRCGTPYRETPRAAGADDGDDDEEENDEDGDAGNGFGGFDGTRGNTLTASLTAGLTASLTPPVQRPVRWSDLDTTTRSWGTDTQSPSFVFRSCVGNLLVSITKPYVR